MNTSWAKPFKYNDYKRILLIAHVGWWSTVLIVFLRALHVLPQSVGLVSLLTLGMGVSGSLGLSRMRLTRAITDVFQVGMKTQTLFNANTLGGVGTAIIESDLTGKITHVDHVEAIGWAQEDLVGQDLTVIIPERFRDKHANGLRKFIESDQSRVANGSTLTVPMVNAIGKEFTVKLNVARLGDALLATITPLQDGE